MRHGHRIGSIDNSGQHSRAATYSERTGGRTDDGRFADCAGKTSALSPSVRFVAAVILVAAVWMLFTNYENRPIRDLKGIIFTQYDVGDSLGKVIGENMSHTKWSSEKRGNDSYDVTVSGVENMYDSLVEATFRVTYIDDAVHGVLTRASVNGQVCTDASDLAVVMLLLYGQLDEDTLAGLMLWNSIW